MAIRYGKTYYQITKVLEEAVKKTTETPVIYASPKTAKRLQEAADMMGVKVDIKITEEKCQKA